MEHQGGGGGGGGAEQGAGQRAAQGAGQRAAQGAGQGGAEPGFWELLACAMRELPHDVRIVTSGFGPICQNCFETKRVQMVCTQCRVARFCNRECQRAAWSRHKKTCCGAFVASGAAWAIPPGHVDLWLTGVLAHILRTYPDLYGTLCDAYSTGTGRADTGIRSLEAALSRGFFEWNSEALKALDRKLRPTESAAQRAQGLADWCGRWRTHVAVLAPDGTFLPHGKFHPCALLLAFACARGIECFPSPSVPFRNPAQLRQVLELLNRPPRGATCDELAQSFLIPGDFPPVPVEPCKPEHATAHVAEGACYNGAMALVRLFTLDSEDSRADQLRGVPTIGSAAFVVDFTGCVMAPTAPAPAPVPAPSPAPSPSPEPAPAPEQEQTQARERAALAVAAPGPGQHCTVKVLLGLGHAVCRGPDGTYMDATMSCATSDGKAVNMATQYLSLLPVVDFDIRIVPPPAPLPSCS